MAGCWSSGLGDVVVEDLAVLEVPDPAAWRPPVRPRLAERPVEEKGPDVHQDGRADADRDAAPAFIAATAQFTSLCGPRATYLVKDLG